MTDTQKERTEITNDDGSLTIKLLYPIDVPTGEKITEVTLKRVKQKAMKAIRNQHKKDPEEMGDAMLASSSGLTLEDIGEMDMADYTYLSERFSDMVGLGSSQGEAQSANTR